MSNMIEYKNVRYEKQNYNFAVEMKKRDWQWLHREVRVAVSLFRSAQKIFHFYVGHTIDFLDDN